VISFILEFINHFYGQNMSVRGLRALQILRPIKALKTVLSMRQQIVALLSSMKGVANVVCIIFFVLMLFAIIGLLWFSGNTHYMCRMTKEPVNGAWEKF
jgi:hypothetical protein